MAFSSMREFADKLETSGELVRITEPVRTELEITALANREMKLPGGGKALLIEKPLLPSGKVAAYGFPFKEQGLGRVPLIGFDVFQWKAPSPKGK